MKTLILLATLALSTSAWSATEISVDIAGPDTTQIRTQVQEVERLSHNFGQVRVGFTDYVRYTLKNTGTTPLTFDKSLIGGIGFDGYHNCNLVLQPNQKCQFEITFTPTSEFSHNGRFFLIFKEDYKVVVDVYGYGSRF